MELAELIEKSLIVQGNNEELSELLEKSLVVQGNNVELSELPEKSLVVQVLMKFPAFHGSHVYVTSLLVHSLSH
jgi:hypothetical protein